MHVDGKEKIPAGTLRSAQRLPGLRIKTQGER
jgi:hypothetical protein